MAKLLHFGHFAGLAVGVVFCEGARFVELHGRFSADLVQTGYRQFTRMATALLLWRAVSDADRLFDRRWNG